jgi:hypothetical protein
MIRLVSMMIEILGIGDRVMEKGPDWKGFCEDQNLLFFFKKKKKGGEISDHSSLCRAQNY